MGPVRASRPAPADAARAAPAALRARAIGRGLETRLWTGSAGHLVGGMLDFGQALARYMLARALNRTVR
jgi:hypothetical protein